MPGRFSHWTHGKMYQMQKTMYDYGLSKIYELVINTNPCWAFLLESNTVLQNEFVVAHVLGHSDFFANNAYYARTSRRMIDTVTLNAERLRRYEFEHGMDQVEGLLDAVISIEEHVDPHAEAEARPAWESPSGNQKPSDYADMWEPEPAAPVPVQVSRIHATPTPCRDLLLFLARESPALEDWERDAVGIVREEMLYFHPQMQTKIINEGWASYWHVRIMRELDFSTDDHLAYAALHSSVLQPSPGRLNPYYLGFTMLNDIERRYDEIDGSGRERLFQIRETENDVSLVRNYLTEELVEELDLYYAERIGDELVITEKDWEGVRDRLVAQIADLRHADDPGGRRRLQPESRIAVAPRLDRPPARPRLRREDVGRRRVGLWGRKVWLETHAGNAQPLMLSYGPRDGHQRHQLSA